MFKFNVCGVLFLFVGPNSFHGNIYGNRGVLRLDFLKGAKAKAVLTLHRLQTTIYWYGWFSFHWNSEAIAMHWGKEMNPDFGGGKIYNGWLGQHIAW